jgi:putative oxidoreductase
MSEHIGKLILRLMLGGMMLLHGIHKLATGTSYIEGLLKMEGLSEYFAYGVYVGEVLAPLLLILGWKSKLWASVIFVNMILALYLTHLSDFFTLGSHGAWAIEVPMLYLLSALAIMLLGGGKYGIEKV